MAFTGILKTRHKQALMCTAVFLRQPRQNWPFIVACNRDEMIDRPSKNPGRHWLDRPDVTAGMDELAGGSWLGINDDGVVSGILNRKGSLGADDVLRSRGELVLEALTHSDAKDAAKALSYINPSAYRSFNLFVADNRDAFWLRNQDSATKKIDLFEIPIGLSMLTSDNLNSKNSQRIQYFLPKFLKSKVPDPENNLWQDWENLLASKKRGPKAGSEEAMFIVTKTGFGTLSSSFLALESADALQPKKIWRFANHTDHSAKYFLIEI